MNYYIYCYALIAGILSCAAYTFVGQTAIKITKLSVESENEVSLNLGLIIIGQAIIRTGAILIIVIIIGLLICFPPHIGLLLLLIWACGVSLGAGYFLGNEIVDSKSS